jgi:sucrose-phosphate synthase
MIALITDIDGTLLGDRSGLDLFNDYLIKIRARVLLVYASGRSYEECMDAVKNDGITPPDIFIASTGADIYYSNGAGGYTPDTEWHLRLDLASWQPDAIRAALNFVEGISPQPDKSAYKIAYFISPASAGETQARMQENMRKKSADALSADSIRAKIIASHGFYIDVLPENCDKGEAAVYVVNKAGLDALDVIVAGDSENDADLFKKFSRGIIVGNAHQGLLDTLKGSDHYKAKSQFAAGILEGLHYYAGKGIIKL